ncbi:MAG: carboxylesterase/lipase family protein [Bacteroidales bacterium]|nr:carboxylesterase/lipase family protein [Bacteroidales bacterium]
MKAIFKLIMATAALTAAVCSCAPADPFIVKTRDGKVKGIEENGTMAFLGIPYAKVERFMPPLPVDKWDTVMVCDHFGPQVMQGNGRREMPESVMSEKNSCVLNVWTTDTKASKPVMLWIHGGGFDSGSAAGNPGYGLAKQDVVVVSLNHRLNILGFLDLSTFGEKYKNSGMVGMLDIVQALEWIRDNIKAFGGDPSNVTIFGESGGGGKVGTLMCMPAAKGLFHKAIIMSGTILNVNTKAMAEELGRAVVEQLGFGPDEVEKMKDVPYGDLVAAGQRAMAASIGTRSPGTPMMWGFGPAPDGEMLLQQPFQPDFASISDDVPLMIGTTFNELQRRVYGTPMTLDEAKEQLKPTFGDRVDEYVAAFAEAWPDYTPQDLLSIDMMFRPKTLITSDAIYAKRKAPMYMYMFTWKSPADQGSVHGYELNFCFNTPDRHGRTLPEVTDADWKLADNMSRSWANFAITGDPNVEGLPAWRPYTAANGECFIFDHECYVRNNFDRPLQEILNACCFKQLDEFNARKAK